MSIFPEELKYTPTEEKEQIAWVEELLRIIKAERQTQINYQDEITSDISPNVVPINKMLLLIRAIHCIRGCELASDALSAFRSGHRVSAVLLARALLESAAMISESLTRVETAEKSGSASEIESTQQNLNKYIFGSRDDTSPVKAINILTVINRVDKDFPDLLKMYDNLSEYAHPNWRGGQGAYGTFNRDDQILNLDWKGLKVPSDVILLPLGFGIILIGDHF